MKTENWTDVILLILGVVWGIIMLILWSRNKSKPQKWPLIFGFGGWVFLFVGSMIMSILSWPKSEFSDYLISNFFWALVGGVVCYFSGHILARRFGK